MSVFTKGCTPWNKGKRGYMGANVTSFTKEQIDAIGKESEGKPKWNSRDGYICLTSERKPVVCARTKKTYMCRKRIPYGRYVLEQAGIEVPKGSIVYHRDGNVENNNIENLEILTRAQLIKRNRNIKITIGESND
jgi:hypothetical protein